MIQFDNISKIYPRNSIALKNVSLRIKPKEFISVVGRSGAGKSTLLKLLLAEEKPTEGRVLFKNHDVHKLKGKELLLVRRKIGAVFQDFKLLPTKTVYENIALAFEVKGRTNQEIKEDVPQVLELVNLRDKADNFPAELSGGEKQKVTLARAIAQQPEIIVADEPTGNLDFINTWDIVNLLVKINQIGHAVLLATHDREIVNALNKRVITLEKGQIIKDEKNGKYTL